MWHLTACEILGNLILEVDQKWNDFLSYSELMLATQIHK